MKKAILSFGILCSILLTQAPTPIEAAKDGLPGLSVADAAADYADENGKGLNVEYHTQDEIRNYIKECDAGLRDEAVFEKEPNPHNPYEPGKLSSQTLESSLQMLNLIRYIAGVPYQVKLSDKLNEEAQAAALLNCVNGELSHTPKKPGDMDNALYALGYAGSQSSNLADAMININATLLWSWMADRDDVNIDRVGHRRWILNPSLGNVGFGMVKGGLRESYFAISICDQSNTTAWQSGVAWPAQNMPTYMIDPYVPWSVSMGIPLNKEDIQVTLVRRKDQKTWRFSSESADGYFNVNNGGYGQKGCIIFRPEEGSVREYADGDTYDVTITGLPDGDVSYSVNFMSEHVYSVQVAKAAPGKNGKITKTCSVCGEETETVIYAPKTVKFAKASYAYNGKAHKPAVTVRDSKGKALRSGTDYTVSYPSGCKDVGSYAVTIHFKGNYTGSRKASFTVVPKGTSLSKLTAKKNGFALKWKKQPVQVTGYEIQYSTSSKFAKKATQTVTAKKGRTSRTVSGLKAKKKYYARIRTYKTVKINGSSSNLYSSWSKAKNVRTKK